MMEHVLLTKVLLVDHNILEVYDQGRYDVSHLLTQQTLMENKAFIYNIFNWIKNQKPPKPLMTQ